MILLSISIIFYGLITQKGNIFFIYSLFFFIGVMVFIKQGNSQSSPQSSS
jgi:hypothetical protein